MIVLLVVLCLIITTILLILFIKPRKTISKYNHLQTKISICLIDRLALLRWNRTATTVAGITSSPGTNPNQFSFPWDLVVDWSYTLYVTDRGGHRVQKFLKGQQNGSTIAGQANGTSGSTANTFDGPTGIFVDDDGNIFVADRNNHRVQYWTNGASTGITYAGNSE